MAAGAATIYRNYFAEVGGQFGQTQDRQLDTLADVRTDMTKASGGCDPLSEPPLCMRFHA
jgi:hypothetical protein